MKKLLLLLLLSQSLHSHEIAITFDDLPSQHNNRTPQLFEMNQTIVNALIEFNAPATGFVNEDKLNARKDFEKNVEILKMWTDAGLPLGNHTYSHCAFSKTDLQDFQADFLKGAIVSKPLTENAGLTYCYFRHPYLDAGRDAEKRLAFESFLKEEGYAVAPVTINTDDWVFNKQLLLHPENADIICEQYINYVKAIITFCQSASEEIFDRNIKHVLLVHVNVITARTIKQLLQLMQELDYKVIPLDQALQDPAYQEPDNYYGSKGPIWLYRWDYTRGIKVNWSNMPNPKDYLKEQTIQG
ncbi:MAG: polysaccharide deacetylase family protein [Candidatus Dependentiae bacterium]|nr:polysaccharide deacetylase family protein [Candidatus Dependentiae bacterium]